MLIATTSPKDSKIEEYVRTKNIEFLDKSLFSIELYCWEDIVDLINENSDTFKWYVTESKFREKYEIWYSEALYLIIRKNLLSNPNLKDLLKDIS